MNGVLEGICKGRDAIAGRYEGSERFVTDLYIAMMTDSGLCCFGRDVQMQISIINTVAESLCHKMTVLYMTEKTTEKEIRELSTGTDVLCTVGLESANSTSMNTIGSLMKDMTVISISMIPLGPWSSARPFFDKFVIHSYTDRIADNLSSFSVPKISCCKIGPSDIGEDKHEVIQQIRSKLSGTSVSVSSERIKSAVELVRKAANLRGREEVHLSDLYLLRDCLSTIPEDAEIIDEIVSECICPCSIELDSLERESTSILKAAVGSRKVMDETAGFPKTVYCADCDTYFVNMKQLRKHHSDYSRHLFIDPRTAKSYIPAENKGLRYEQLLAKLKHEAKWDLFSPGTVDNGLLAPIAQLKKRASELEKSIDDERKPFMEEVNRNGILTDADKGKIGRSLERTSEKMSLIKKDLSFSEYILG